MRKLKSNKAVQDIDIPVKMLQENAQFFVDYLSSI